MHLTSDIEEKILPGLSNQTRKKQPNSRNCFVCGVENTYGLNLSFYSTKLGEVTVETVVPDRFQGYPGVVHGGIVASLVDEVLGRAHMGEDPRVSRRFQSDGLAQSETDRQRLLSVS